MLTEFHDTSEHHFSVIQVCVCVCVMQITAIVLCLALGLEEYWKTPPVEATVDDFNRVKYEPKPSLT